MNDSGHLQTVIWRASGAARRGLAPRAGLVVLLALAGCRPPGTDNTGDDVLSDTSPGVVTRPTPTLAELLEDTEFSTGGLLPKHDPIGEGFSGPMGSPIPMATPEQLEAFARGEILARKRFTPEEGLGPQFTGVSCLSCHERPVLGGGAELYRNVYMAGVYQTGRGYVLSPLVPETRPIAVSDGVFRTYNLDDLGGPAQQPIQADVGLMAARNPTPFFGSGVIMTVPVDAIEALMDPEDDDGDGISGRPNIDAGVVGRLGSKSMGAGHTSIMRIDLYVHAGLSVELPDLETIARLPFPDQLTGSGAFLSDPNDPYPDPEVNAEDYFDLLSWAQLLAAPEFDPLDHYSGRGRDLFEAIGCASCHVPRLPSPYGPIPAYTDYLLHDMGEDLWDGYVMDYSYGGEFKTAALWGLASTGPYLHDGRAKTIDEAVRWHGGEATVAHDLYLDLTESDQGAIVAFLKTLGGASLESDGLLPPGTPIRPAGSLGGPLPGLSATELQTFERGRAMFDYAFGVAEGLGDPGFNGDTCRGCHSDPYIGGSGPLDVNVLRIGRVDEDGVAHALPEGNMVHRMLLFESDPNRPSPSGNVIEMRQTPALFGYGLIDGISDATLRANADPDDTRAPFGISGRVGLSADGRVARFGWKALVPTLYEFTEGALHEEMGLTVPDRSAPGAFGSHADSDLAQDPEVSSADIAAMTAFVAMLAPPPRGNVNAAVNAGEAVFTRVGCADCHLPALPGASGPVALYSDLLLHEILPPGTPGIEQGVAGQTEFRTAPLWGVSHTGPWLHTGRASTLDAAILAHAGEGAASRDAYAAALLADRDALLAFLRSL